MSNPFAKILALAGGTGLLQSKGESVIGIDIGSSSIKIVQLKKDHGRIILETYGELATGPYADLAVGQAVTLQPEKLGEMAQDLIKEANITTSIGAFSIPLKSSLLVVLEMPDIKPAELAKAIPIEARKYVPVPISEVALDWWIIPHPENTFEEEEVGEEKEKGGVPKGKVEVLAVAIHKGTLTQYDSIAQLARVQSKFFEIETFSAIRSSFVGHDLGATAIIDMGAGTTKMAIVDSGIVKLSHTIGKGSQDVTVAISKSLGVDFAKAEEVKREIGLNRPSKQLPGRSLSIDDVGFATNPIVEYIFAEANRVIVNYQKKYKRSVDRAVLIGGGALLKGVHDVAVRYLGSEVSIGNPFEKVESPAFLSPVLKEAGPEFAVSIGLALRLLQQ